MKVCQIIKFIEKPTFKDVEGYCFDCNFSESSPYFPFSLLFANDVQEDICNPQAECFLCYDSIPIGKDIIIDFIKLNDKLYTRATDYYLSHDYTAKWSKRKFPDGSTIAYLLHELEREDVKWLKVLLGSQKAREYLAANPIKKQSKNLCRKSVGKKHS